MTLRERNHYAAQGYLKRWASDGKKLWTYRTLVSRDRVAPWELQSVKSVARLDHLYTQFTDGTPHDSVERWLDANIDSPSAVVLDKVAAEERLSARDYSVLVQFFAASHARTPGYMLRRRPEWEKQIPSLMQSTLERSVKAPENAGPTGDHEHEGRPSVELSSPFRVRVRAHATGEGGVVESQAVIGRSLWMHELVRWADIAHRHLRSAAWAVRRAPSGTYWFTSDDPAVIASVSAERSVALGRPVSGQQTFAFIALDPSHLLYAKFGQRVPGRYAVMDEAETDFVQRCIVMNAHRLVFSLRADEWVSAARPRRVDAAAVARDRQAWTGWASEQMLAELALEDESTWPEVVRGQPICTPRKDDPERE